METKFRVIQLMFMHLVLIYLKAITLILLRLSEQDIDMNNTFTETVFLKKDILDLADEIQNT